MAELTAEYLDKKLAEQTEHFDKKIDEQTEALARMVKAGFVDITERLDVREQVLQHGRDIAAVKQALKLA